MRPRTLGEKGQAAPIYVTVVAGLLFLALAFFVVGQAGALRNGAQTAADAAALAAAKESRDVFEPLLLANADPVFLEATFNRGAVGTWAGCSAAGPMARQNNAELQGCAGPDGSRWIFSVQVRSQKSVGDTVLPGTEARKAEAEAAAEVQSRCRYESVPKPTLRCDRIVWEVGDGDLPDMSELFKVRLAEN
ncbi:pilus assembly protein TadG-related protein [Streptomyces sp. NPDC059165]|uniref:pilus assembly protein TadG-related protein n=1 Tax=Streptomyces sp. NPDC059165 TaxID=3346751 RepID=UPI0036A643C9